MKKNILKYTIAIGLIFSTSNLFCQHLFTGIWRQGTDVHSTLAGLEWNEFNTTWGNMNNQNLRLSDLEVYMQNGKPYFMSVWRQASDAHALIAPVEWAQFNSEWIRVSKEGLRLTDISTYLQNGKRYFVGVYRQGNDAHALIPPVEWAQFNSEWARLSKEGLRIVDVETYVQNGKVYYTGVYRQGNDAHALIPALEWEQFNSEWKRISKEGLRLTDVETYRQNGKRYYLSVYREGNDSHFLWSGADWEQFNAVWAANNKQNLRLTDIITYENGCNNECLNKVLQPYSYFIKGSSLHCDGIPGNCTASNTQGVWYNWPSTKIDGVDYVRMSAVGIKDQLFTLPFKVPATDMNAYNGWMYGPDQWHHAYDYSTGKNGLKTFLVVAAARGRVIHMDWDDWSGNTIIISHDTRERKDAYRTIYMHLRNGPQNDCELSWARGVAASGGDEAKYKQYLASCGCPENKSLRNPREAEWGNNSQKFDMGLLGKWVNAGDPIAWAGSTGPGGSGGNHLHIFFAHRDPSDNKWYFFDPSGIYSYNSCYPTKVDGPINYDCVRYPVAWKNGRPGYPN